MLEKFLPKTLHFKIKSLNLWTQTSFLLKCEIQILPLEKGTEKRIEFAVDAISILGMLH